MKRKRETAQDENSQLLPRIGSNGSRIKRSTKSINAPTGCIDKSVGKMDNRLLADHLAQRTREYSERLSVVELADLHVPESAISDTSGWERERSIEGLPDFLVHFAQDNEKAMRLTVAPRQLGAPHTLVLTAAALRAASLARYNAFPSMLLRFTSSQSARVLRHFQRQNATVAKLFAKHIKLKDACDFAQRTRISIGVGTPSRILELIDLGALTTESLDRIVIDRSYLDQKQRSILDMRETQQPLQQILARPEVKARYLTTTTSRPVKLIFY
ncbi:MAG: hypothetical protein Q9220_005129 [cf. Caloplaca sp. 1 TL-2023]